MGVAHSFCYILLVATNEVQIAVDSNFSELPLKACDYAETHKRKL